MILIPKERKEKAKKILSPPKKNKKNDNFQSHQRQFLCPTAFQVRIYCALGGFKGLLIVCDKLENSPYEIVLTESMQKYKFGPVSDSTEVCVFQKKKIEGGFV